MVVPESGINNIMGGLESAEGVRLHNHRRKLRQRFDIVRKLGQGTYGKVQLGINKETGQEVAIKIIKKCKIKTEADLIRIRREIQIMSSVRHPNIIHIYEVFENQDKMVLVMEYAAGGELYEYLNERNVLTEEEARRIFRQIATAIYYCHKHKICHRDLKLENILLDEHGSAKIADFGLSNVFCESRLLTTFCGSPLYASPEIVKGIPYHGPEVDCWSLGVLLYILVYKAMPFDGSNFKRLVRQISQGDYFEPKNPSPASPLIRSMLNVNPSHRADIISICSNWWVDQTYSESCLEIAEDLANQTPVRLDLLLSLVPSVSSEKLVIGDIQVDPQSSEKPVRSQSLDSIAPLRANSSITPIVSPIDSSVTPVADKKATGGEKVKAKTKSKRERSSSRTRKKESSTSIDSDADGMKPKKKSVKKEEKRAREVEEPQPEILENDAENVEKLKENIRLINDSLKNSEAKEVPEDPEKYTLDVKEVPPPVESETEKKESKQEPLLEKSANDPNVEKSKLNERRRSKVFETAEKFSTLNNNTQATKPAKKIFLPGVKVGDAKREYERKSSLVESSSSLARMSPSRKSFSGKSKSPSPTASPDKKYSLASTINLNKLAESALKKSSEDVTPSSSAEVSRTSSISAANEVPAPPVPSVKKLPERAKEETSEAPRKKSPEKAASKKPVDKISKESSESSLSKSSSANTTPPTEPDPTHQAKVKNAVKVISHAISGDGENKAATMPRRKTSRAEIILAPPRSIPVRIPEYKSEVEHFINQPQAPLKSQVTIPIAAPLLPKPTSKPAGPTKEHIIPIQFEEEVSKTPTPPSSLHSLSKQSTFDSDSQISMSSSGDPIRKSAREVIIPIAVEGGGYVTPASDNMSRISSFDDAEEERPRCFTLHSTRRRHPHSDRIESTDSISSDEDDDNFEILTAENLFSTLLNRVRSLTHKLSTEDGAHHAFPRSFFTQHQSIFDNLPSRRLTGTRSFARNDSAPWRRRPISSIPPDVPETYSTRRVSKDLERAPRFDEKPPPYQSRSSYSTSRPSYLRSLSNSLSSSNAYTNQYPWKYKTDEQETNSANSENRDNFRKGIHRHSFHGTGLDYSKYNGNFNPENLKLDDLNLPMIPEIGTGKSDSASSRYSSRWSKSSDTSSSQPESRRSSESRDDDATPVASPDPKSRHSPSPFTSESRVSRIPTFQRSNSVSRETGGRRLYQRSFSVTPERSVNSRFLSNGPTSRASTPEPSSYPPRPSRFLSSPTASTRQTPDRKLPENSADKTVRYRRYGVSSSASPLLPPSSRLSSRLTYSGSSSNCALDKDDKSSLKSSSSRLSSHSFSHSNSSSNCVNPDDKISSRRSSRSLIYSSSSSNCVNAADQEDKSVKSSSSRLSSRGLAYSSSSSNCANPDKEDKASVKSNSSRLSLRSLTHSNSASNCSNQQDNKSLTNSRSFGQKSQGLSSSASVSNCAHPEKENKSLMKSSSLNKVSGINLRRNLQKVSSDAAINVNGKTDLAPKTRKLAPYTRSQTAAVNTCNKPGVIPRRSSLTSDKDSLKAASERASQNFNVSANIEASTSASSLARNTVDREERKISGLRKPAAKSKEKSSSSPYTSNSKIEKSTLSNPETLQNDSPAKQSKIENSSKNVEARSSYSELANVSEVVGGRSRIGSARGEYSQQSEITEGSITNQSSFSDFDESYVSSRRTSSTSTFNDLTEIRARLSGSRINELVTSRDESVNRQEDLTAQKTETQRRRDRLLDEIDSASSSRENQQFTPKPTAKTTFKPQTVSSILKSRFEVSTSDSVSNTDCNFKAELPKKTSTLVNKREVKDLMGETVPSSSKLQRYSEVLPGKNGDSSLDEESANRKRVSRFLETKITKSGRPILNYEFHRRLTSPSYQEERGGNWIQDSSTSRFLNPLLRRSPSRPRQVEDTTQENGVSAVPTRSSSGILVKRSASSSSVKKDSAGPSKPSLKDLKFGPKIMYTSEISSFDETSSLISPTEDGSDTWSASSDYTDAFDYLPPSGRSHSCPSGEESVSDRIRRKSYYTRFNPSISSRRFLNSTMNFTNTLRPGSRLPSYSRSFSSDMTRSLNKF